MNYRRSKFSKRLPFLQLSYYNYSTCATYAISGQVAVPYGNTLKFLKMTSDIIFLTKLWL